MSVGQNINVEQGGFWRGTPGSGAAGTRARRKAYLGDVIAPKIVERGGGIVKTTGGGLPGAFSSVVYARRGAANAPSAPARSSLDTNA